MKITPEDRTRMAELIAPFDTEVNREAYRALRIPRGDAVKDINVRYRWDLWRAANRLDGYNLGTHIYTYADDRHIDTALRSIVPPL